MISVIVKKEEAGQTLEKYVRKVLKEAPLSYIYKLFRKKDIKVNGHWQKEKYIVSEKDNITVYITDSQLEEFKKKNELSPNDSIKNLIIYEDSNILLVNKPRGILVQKDESCAKALDTMVLEYLMSKNEFNPNNDLGFTPGPAHRIDRNTSGIVIFGKNIKTLQYLFSIIKDKEEIAKRYLVLVKGDIEEDGSVEVPLKKDEKTGKVYPSSLKEGGKPAKTIYKVKQRYKGFTLLEAILVTGRTHQIRVHLSYINHPVIGDAKYGDFQTNHEFEKLFGFKNQFLHAYKISFGNLTEPLGYLSKKSFEIELTNEYLKILDNLPKI